METTFPNARRPWLAALMSVLGIPLGQIYTGRLRRGFGLWLIGGVLLPVLAFTTVSLPIGSWGLAILLVCALAFPVFLAVDAYLVAKRHRYAPRKRYQRWWVYLLAFVTFAVANNFVAWATRSFVAEAFVVPTRAMSPTILPGDRIVVDRLWYRPSQLQRGDVIVFRSPGPDSALYVMRLVGLPGDEVEIADETVLLNGEKWRDTHALIDESLPANPELSNYGPTRVPPQSFFVLGDNRRLSKDSRIIGPIRFSDVYGKACLIYWSRERRFSNPWDTSAYETGPVNWSRIGARLD